MINFEEIINYTSEKLPTITKKLKDTNEDEGISSQFLTNAKDFYDDYKKLLSEVKNKYLMRSYEDLKVDMKRLAPRIQYLVQIVKDIINGFAEKNVVAMYWIFLIMNTSLYKY